MRIDTYLLLVIGMVLMCSCNRKSGRLQSTSKPRTEQKYRKEEHVSSSNNSGQIMTAKQIFQKYNEAVFMVFTSDGYNSFQGSGFFISSKGIAVSNYHVFRGTAVGLEVIKLSSGDELRIDEVIAKSEENDFIVFKVQASKRRNFTYIPISKRDFSVGDKIYTIGSPRGLENTFSSGEISQKRGDNLIQINAPIDHGSSGGALINAYGEAIGITSGGRDDSGANLNFAINIKVIQTSF